MEVVLVSSVQALQDTFVLGMLVGDPDLCASVYAPNAVFVPPNREQLYGRREIRDFWWQVIDGGGRGDAVITEKIERTGQDQIIEFGQYARFAEPVLLDRPVARGSYLVALERQPNGRWVWAADIWNDHLRATPSARVH
jgi:ketosteroid isomerase-like protein